MNFAQFDSPLGSIHAFFAADALTGLYFVGQKHARTLAAGDSQIEPSDGRVARLSAWLDAYFAGRAAVYHGALSLGGTPFQQAVWQALLHIPRASTCTYSDLAARLSKAGAARAVGAAVGRNPVAIIVPCHRVVGSAGALTGYAGGVARKAALLRLEAANTGSSGATIC